MTKLKRVGIKCQIWLTLPTMVLTMDVAGLCNGRRDEALGEDREGTWRWEMSKEGRVGKTEKSLK